MSITPRNVLKHELIDLDVKIEKSTSRSMQGLTGRVVDESYGTLTIETTVKPRKTKARKKKSKKSVEVYSKVVEKVIPKSNSIFIFTLPNGVKVQVEGRLLVGRPEDRIKKRFARW